MAMGVTCQCFWMPRRGHSRDEYEDACASNVASGRYAVADGASEGAFSRLWARLLVDGFTQSTDRELPRWLASLSPLQAEWVATVQSRELPWYGEGQLAQGAFATFLGLLVHASEDGPYSWSAVSVGDCCLFHTRNQELLTAFPTENPKDFGNDPRLLGSRMPVEKATVYAHYAAATASSGDMLWMMTDALAQWCLTSHHGGAKPWRDMEALLESDVTPESFETWIEELRTSGHLQNDDVTLMVLRFF